MIELYCVKCKQKTETLDVTKVITKINRNMLKGICTICGKNKASFVSNKVGEGFSLNNLVNNLPFEIHQFAEKEKMFLVDFLMINKNILTVVLEQSMNKELTKDIKELMN